MKKQKAKCNINIEKLAGGAFSEKFNEALMQVAENIQNPNTEATTKRGITISIKFTPNKNRQMVNTSIAVTTKLASTEAIDTQMVMGVNMKTGTVEVAEYDSTNGQLSMWSAEPDEEAEEIQTDEAKPLDLRNRGKSFDEEIASIAASGLIAGKDFDPSTGEVYKNDSVVLFNSRAKRA